jgi:hypothetical protein
MLPYTLKANMLKLKSTIASPQFQLSRFLRIKLTPQ